MDQGPHRSGLEGAVAGVVAGQPQLEARPNDREPPPGRGPEACRARSEVRQLEDSGAQRVVDQRAEPIDGVAAAHVHDGAGDRSDGDPAPPRPIILWERERPMAAHARQLELVRARGRDLEGVVGAEPPDAQRRRVRRECPALRGPRRSEDRLLPLRGCPAHAVHPGAEAVPPAALQPVVELLAGEADSGGDVDPDQSVATFSPLQCLSINVIPRLCGAPLTPSGSRPGPSSRTFNDPKGRAAWG